jgi:hypothetical protein
MSTKRLIPLLVLLAAAGTAHATPVDDFKAGTAVVVETATVDVGGGPRTSTEGRVIAKQGGTFDFALQASDLGVELPITINLRGTALADGRLQLDIDNTYSPAIDLGGGQSLSRVTGRIVMRALPVPGGELHDVGNARLQLAAASRLVAHGTWGSVTIAIAKLLLIGGVPQPPLDRFTNPSSSLTCSGGVATYHLLAVSLTGLATASGAAVELKGPTGAGVRVPGIVVVRPNRQAASVTARIEPSFVGRVRLTAAAGGVSRSLDVDVRPSSDCAHP